MRETDIRTERLHLRPLTPRDSGRVTQVVADPRVHRMLARVPPGQTKAQTLAWILTHERSRAEDIGHVFAITRGGHLLGVTGAHRASTDLPFEVGYWLAPEVWGQGFVTEASAGLIRWLEGHKGARALVSGHFADNPASGRVLAKLGFLPSGRDRRYCSGRGEIAEHILMARIS